MKSQKDTSTEPNFKDSLNGIMTINGQGKFIYCESPVDDIFRGEYRKIRDGLYAPKISFKVSS